MNEKLACRCGLANHCIFVHDMNDTKGICQNVTQTAITAVRDYMVDDIPKGQDRVGYMWKRDDGKVVRLICVIE